MEKDKINKKGLIIIILVVIVVIVMIAMAIINLSKPGYALEGSYTYNGNVKFDFNGKGKGTLQENGTKYKYTYSLDGNILSIDYKSKDKDDVSYIFDLKNDILTLVNKDDSTGTQYIFRKDR